MNFRSLRLILWLIVAVASSWFVIARLTPSGDRQSVAASAGTTLPIKDPYVTLLDSNAQLFDTQSLKGSHQLVYFGFTYCPDVCPISSRKMVVAETLYNKTAAPIEAHSLFITIDPERDTPEIMGFFAENLVDDVLFDVPEAEREAVAPNLIGLSGDRAQIDAAIETFKVYADMVTDGDGPDDYRFNHSDLIYWVRPDGGVEFFSPRQSAQDIANAMIAASQAANS